MQELQHSKYHLADTLCNESVPVMVREVYQFLTGYAEPTDSNDSDIRKKTEKWMRELLLLEPALELADNLFNRLSANNAMLDEPLPSSGDTSQPLPSIPENDPLQIGGIHHKQVSSIHYQGISYHKKGRFCSYWHQIDEVFNQEPQNVLEIGTGNGFVSDFLIKNGFDLSTLDIDPDLNPTVVGTVLDIPFPDNNFDLVLCCQVLEHLPYESFIPALMQLNRVTRKSVILSLPDMQKVSTIHFQNTKTRFTVFYRHLFSKPIDWKFDGQHYWNIGNKNYPLKRIMDDILTTNFGITRHFRVPENPGHHFFILKK
jgi:SAM-dependent methyltransferase